MSGVSAAENTSGPAVGLPRIDEARGRRRAATAYAIVFAALVAACWGRLALPLTSAECRFVQQGLRLLALDGGGDFAAEGAAGEARVLAHVMLQTGATERALRLGVMIGLFLGGALLLETLRARRISTGAFLGAACAGIPAAADAELLLPAYLAFAPLCAVLTSLRAGGGFGGAAAATAASVAGAAATAALEPRLGLAAASFAALAALAELRPAAFLRTLLALGAAALVARESGLGLPPVVAYVEPSQDLSAWFLSRLLPGGGAADAYVAGSATAAVLLLGAILAGRGRRAAVVGGLAAAVIAVFAGGRFIVDGAALDPVRAATLALPFVLRFAAREAEEAAAPLRLLVALAALAGAAAPFALRLPAPERDDPRRLLADLRAVSSTRDAAALAGPGRVGAAVYARLGHDPNLPLLFVPESASPANLAAAARAAGARVLWTDFDAADVPGLSPAPTNDAASRPAGLRRYAVADR